MGVESSIFVSPLPGRNSTRNSFDVFLVITLFPPVKAKTYVFMRFTGIRVRRRIKEGWLCTFRLNWHKKLRFILQDWQIRSFLRQIDFISEPNAYPVRLDKIGGRCAIDAMLHGLSFEDYLCCENYYQGYLYSQNVSQLKSLYNYLYKKKPGIKGSLQVAFSRIKEYELVSVFLWWGSVKLYFTSLFPHFFQPFHRSTDADQPELPDLMGAMNAQIRALTGGDVTKEKEVLQMDRTGRQSTRYSNPKIKTKWTQVNSSTGMPISRS